VAVGARPVRVPSSLSEPAMVVTALVARSTMRMACRATWAPRRCGRRRTAWGRVSAQREVVGREARQRSDAVRGARHSAHAGDGVTV